MSNVCKKLALRERPPSSFNYFYFLVASLPGTMAAHQLVVSIRQKCSPEEVLGVLKDLPNPLSEEEADSRFNPLKIDVFVQTLLNLGSKSFSHSFAAISKYHYVFKVKHIKIVCQTFLQCLQFCRRF